MVRNDWSPWSENRQAHVKSLGGAAGAYDPLRNMHGARDLVYSDRRLVQAETYPLAFPGHELILRTGTESSARACDVFPLTNTPVPRGAAVVGIRRALSRPNKNSAAPFFYVASFKFKVWRWGPTGPRSPASTGSAAGVLLRLDATLVAVEVAALVLIAAPAPARLVPAEGRVGGRFRFTAEGLRDGAEQSHCLRPSPGGMAVDQS